MYSSENYLTLEETLAQFYFVLKQLLVVHQEFNSLLVDYEKLACEEWFAGLYPSTFTALCFS